MRVLVTGGTGFVGVHAVAALVEAGHEVRLLVRSAERVGPNLAPLDVPESALDDVVSGDVTDAASVEAALAGCEAVVHAASVYTLDPRRAEEIERTNVGGTRLVLGKAREMGLDPILHVSSYTALLPAREERMTRDSRPGEGCGPYSRSKADSERVARGWQTRGAPVVSVMPGMIWGPHDPYHGETDRIVKDYLRGRLRLLVRDSIVPTVDVRDVARVVVAALEPGLGPRRYLATGRSPPFEKVLAVVDEITGRPIRTMSAPASLARMFAGAADMLQRVSPWRLPVAAETVRVVSSTALCDDHTTRKELGVKPRPLEDTVRDTLVSLVERGHLGQEAGALAPAGD